MRNREYLLTFSQIFTLNKIMPKGWKIELFENMRIFETIYKPQLQIKRPRSSYIIKDNSEEEEEIINKKKVKKSDLDVYSKEEDSFSSKKSTSFKNISNHLSEKRPNNNKDLYEVEIEKKIKENPNIDVSKNCEKTFNKLKKHPLCDYFLSQNNEKYSLKEIEKKIKISAYSSSYQFGMEIRGIWNYNFSKSTINSDIYQKTITLSNYFEEIFKDIENTSDVIGEIHEIHKIVSKLHEKVCTLNKNSANTNNMKQEKILSISEKPMTTSEKTQLGIKIKMLNYDQLKGIIKIVSDSITMVEQNSKYFEFDIETLPTKKLRELEKYVKNCLKAKSSLILSQNIQIISLENNLTSKDNNKKTNTVNNNILSNNEQILKKNNSTINKSLLNRPLKRPFEHEEIITPKSDKLKVIFFIKVSE